MLQTGDDVDREPVHGVPLDYSAQPRGRHRFFRWSVRPVLAALALAVVVVVGACVLLLFWTKGPSTAFTDGFSKTKFAAITYGMTLSDVNREVGYPLAFLVQGDARSPSGGWTHHDFAGESHLIAQTNGRGRFILFYSKQATPGRPYELYLVDFESSRVTGTAVHKIGD